MYIKIRLTSIIKEKCKSSFFYLHISKASCTTTLIFMQLFSKPASQCNSLNYVTMKAESNKNVQFTESEAVSQ